VGHLKNKDRLIGGGSMSDLNTTIRGYTRYRGREGQWSFLLHRLTGLGTLLFLTIHILDTATVYFAPAFYRDVIAVYRLPIFGLGEIALVFAVLFHGFNGLRIAVFDLFSPRAWMIQYERNSTLYTLVVTLVFWIPSAVWMLRNIIVYSFGSGG
jgi:succinate dehydrogenase / fumarate reductase cytochrome b subunit